MHLVSSPVPDNNNATWSALIDQLHKLKNFRIHTGNINNFMELKLKRFTNSAEELGESLKIILNNLPSDIQIEADGMLLLVDKKQCENAYEREDVKITLKLFLEKFDYEHVKDATEAVIKQLQTDAIEQLIFLFPEPDCNVSQDEIDAKWFQEVMKIWREAESGLVAQRKVLNLGVSDFQLLELQRLVKEAVCKPAVAHVFIDGCCVVAPELQAFAKQNSIQLLTHSDPKPFPLKQVFHSFCEQKSLNSERSTQTCVTLFEPVWAARYTVWVRRRSLMAAKGFIVQFANAPTGL